MTADPGAGMSFVADPKKPVGGHILAHASATRIMVSRSNVKPPVNLRMLTVTVRAGSRLPKSSKMVITAEMSKIAQK